MVEVTRKRRRQRQKENSETLAFSNVFNDNNLPERHVQMGKERRWGKRKAVPFQARLLFTFHHCFHDLYQCSKDGRIDLLLCLIQKSAN